MIYLETASGSTYKIDQEGKRIARVSGVKTPQPRQGADGDWKDYEAISPIELESPLVIRWPASVPLLEGSPSGAMPATMTSPVVRIWVRS